MRTLADALALLVALPLAAQLPVKELDVIPLAPGVHGLVWKDVLTDPIEGNVLVIVNDQDVVLVDSSFLPATAERLVAEIKKLTPKPVRYVINTHWHNDHVQGNHVYKDHWPAVEFISHRFTRRDVIERAFETIPEDRKSLLERIADMERWVKEGKDDSGKVVDEARRGRIERAIRLLRGYHEGTASIRRTPPDLTFEQEFVIHRGARTIEVRYLGRGNTRGDAVVYLPQEKIVATGDLIVHPSPFGFGSYYREWIDTLGKVAALDATMIFPGHGPVMRDRKYIESLQALLRALTERVQAAVDRGLSLEETKKEVTLEDFKKGFAGENAEIGRAFEAFFLTPAVERAWRQAKNEPEAFEQKVR